MSMMAIQITSRTIVYSTVYSGADQRKHQSSALLAFVRGIHRWPVNSPHKGSVTRKIFPFDDVIMMSCYGHMWDICLLTSIYFHGLSVIDNAWIVEAFQQVCGRGGGVVINSMFYQHILIVIRSWRQQCQYLGLTKNSAHIGKISLFDSHTTITEAENADKVYVAFPIWVFVVWPSGNKYWH